MKSAEELPVNHTTTEPHQEDSETVVREVKKWKEEDFGVMLGDMIRLNDTEFFSKNPDEYKEKCYQTFAEMKQYMIDQGAEYFEEMTDLYNRYQQLHEPIVIRREDPVKVMQLIEGKNIDIHFDPEVAGDGGEKYANAALWPYGSVNATTGLANAFLEGRNKSGPIVVVAGFKNNREHMELTDLADKMETLGTISRHSVKILSGTIKPEDLEFVAVRISANFINDSELNAEEKDKKKAGKLQQVFRGFSFAKQKNSL